MFRTERYDWQRHPVDSFECGNDELDEWLKRDARGAYGSGSARSYLWIDDSNQVRGYFALAPTTIESEVIPGKEARGFPRNAPAILLAKLALHIELRGHDPPKGPVLLVNALGIALEGVSQIGGCAIVVDAIDDKAHRFYSKSGFIATTNEGQLVMRASRAAKAIGLAWPP